MSVYIQFIRRRTYVAYTRLHSCIFGYAKIGANRCPLEVRMRRNVYWWIRSSKLEILTHFGWSQTMSLDLYIRLSWRTGHFKCSFHGHSSNLRTLEHFFKAFSLSSWCNGAFVYFLANSLGSYSSGAHFFPLQLGPVADLEKIFRRGWAKKS